MGRPAVFVWKAASATSVALVQTNAAGPFPANLVLNGAETTNTRADSSNTFANFRNVQRVATLTSTNNLSGVNFTITGTLHNSTNVVSQTIVGPNNNTVATTQVFNTITSITFDAAVTAISAGTGQTGFTNWFRNDHYISVANLGVQGVVTGAITYSFEATLDDLSFNVPINPALFNPIAAMTAATTNQLASTTQPMMFCRIAITASTTTATLIVTFVPEGLKA